MEFPLFRSIISPRSKNWGHFWQRYGTSKWKQHSWTKKKRVTKWMTAGTEPNYTSGSQKLIVWRRNTALTNVPRDIRFAVNNVQENLGVKKTVYPPGDGRYVRFCDFQTYYSHMANSLYAGCLHPQFEKWNINLVIKFDNVKLTLSKFSFLDFYDVCCSFEEFVR